MNIVKPKKNQVLRGTDALSVVGVLCVVCYVFVYILAGQAGDNKLDTAKLEMESLSAQIMAAGMKSLPPTGSIRGLANVAGASESITWVQDWDNVGTEGKIGKDPWGQPFHYIVVKTDAKTAKYVVVISGGPDKELETPVETIAEKPMAKRFNISYVGDDFGLVRAIP